MPPASPWRAFGDDEALTTNELLVRMADLDESGPWASWVETDRDGTTISTRSGESKLGRALRHFGEGQTAIKAQRLPQAGRKRGYLRANLQPHAARYVAEVVHVVPDPMVEPKPGNAKLSLRHSEPFPPGDGFPPTQAILVGMDDMDNYEPGAGGKEAGAWVWGDKSVTDAEPVTDGGENGRDEAEIERLLDLGEELGLVGGDA